MKKISVASILAVILATSPITKAFASKTHSHTPSKPIVSYAMYDGDRAEKGKWVTLGTANPWPTFSAISDDDEKNVDEMIDLERSWILQRDYAVIKAETDTKAARDECLNSGKKSKQRCRSITIEPDIETDPVVLESSGDDNATGLRAGLIRHMAALAKPDGWMEEVQAIKAQPDNLEKLRMAAEWVDQRLSYYRRVTNPKGLGRNDPWFSEWTQGIEQAFTHGFGDCRDYATAQYALAVEGGFPPDSIAIGGVLMASSGNLSNLSEDEKDKDIVHVLVLARVDGRSYILMQAWRNPNIAKVEPASKSLLADHGLLFIAKPGGARYFTPQGSSGAKAYAMDSK